MDNILNSQVPIRAKLEKDDYVKACKAILKMKKDERKCLVYAISFILCIIAIVAGTLKGINESNKLIQEEMRITFDNIGVEYKSERSLSKINWNEIYKVYISQDFFVIFISDRTVWIIPKKYADYTDASTLVNTFKTNLEKKKVKIAKY